MRQCDQEHMGDMDRGNALAELPSGTVTFLFTDIEGSTALWERDRQAMATAVESHIALLDAAIAAHGDVHFKTVGDAGAGRICDCAVWYADAAHQKTP